MPKLSIKYTHNMISADFLTNESSGYERYTWSQKRKKEKKCMNANAMNIEHIRNVNICVECGVWIQTFSWRSIWRYAATITAPLFQNSRQSNGKQKNYFVFFFSRSSSVKLARKKIYYYCIYSHHCATHAWIHITQRKKTIRQIGMGERVSEWLLNNTTNERW